MYITFCLQNPSLLYRPQTGKLAISTLAEKKDADEEPETAAMSRGMDTCVGA